MCGIAGIISKTQRAFDYSAFCSLGIINDRRGGDSCGVFIDGNVEYGVGNDKLFENFFLGSELLNNTRRSTVALVHCRKASVGAINKDTAQPVVLRDSKGKVQFVVIHNGTIYNYKELANKYIPEIDIKGMTDSQVMARIFFNSGYDVLDEYNGGSVFVIVDYRSRSPKTLLFKGSSKDYHYSKEATEERPLYYCINAKNRELVFSSIASQLMAVRRDDDAYIMTPNLLLEFDGKDLVIVKEYPRTKCIQKKETVATPVYSTSYDRYETAVFRDYISVDLELNLFMSDGKKCHGRFYLGPWGRIYSKPGDEIYNVWFFNGVPLLDINCFRFLSMLMKESRLPIHDFSVKFENVIRFLSLDGVYPKNGLWYKAMTPTESTLYSGEFQPITVQSCITCGLGKKVFTCYKETRPNMEKLCNQHREFNFKIVKDKCKSLMK